MQSERYQVLDRLSAHFQRLYPRAAARCMQRLNMMLGRYGLEPDHGPAPAGSWSQNDALLITYGDTLGNPGEQPLATLRSFLNDHLRDVISAVHILPFFPYSSDDGFSVVDYRRVNPQLGSWNDIKALSGDFRLMSDLVINHVSRDSPWFLDYSHGLLPERHYFIEADPGEDLSAVVRPRNLPLLTPVHTRDGLRHVWTTFSDDQVDLDFSNPDVLFEFLDILMHYIDHGVQVVRLDAIAYLWKQKGTDCIHRPETHVVVRLIRDFLRLVAPDTTIITETNVPHDENISYFGDGDEAHMVYQFPLPPLLLHAALTGNCRCLTRWAAELADGELPPGCTFLNFTASHDGIGVRPLEGLIPDTELQQLVDDVHERGGHVSARGMADGTEKPYELNITYFDAVAVPDADEETNIRRFLSTQAVALSLRGVPAVYIHSLLGMRNDHQAVERTGRARSINRSRLQAPDVVRELNDLSTTRCRLFRRSKRLLYCRTQHAAFHPDGAQTVLDVNPGVFAIERTAPAGHENVLCLVNMGSGPASIAMPERYGPGPWRDIITEDLKGAGSGELQLQPHEPLWLVQNGDAGYDV